MTKVRHDLFGIALIYIEQFKKKNNKFSTFYFTFIN